MSSNLKDVLIALLPGGSLWDLDESGDLYKTIEAMGDNHEPVYEYLKNLAYVREPLLTPFLSDLEKEYGIATNSSLTEQERREFLHGVAYAPVSTGTYEYLQDQLRSAGFAGIQVHENSPAVSPDLFMGGPGGEMVTNNVYYDRTIAEATKDRGLWSYVFFIGGDAYRAGNGEIRAIAPYIISDDLKPLFRELVLKYKPMHSWAIVVINDVDCFEFSPHDFAIIDVARGFADDTQTIGGFFAARYPYGSMIYDDLTWEFLVDGTDYLTEA